MAAAAICLQTSQLTDAIEQLNSVYLRQPNNTMALYTLGHCYERLGFESQAIEFYQDCLKFKNYLQLPRQRLAAIYFKNSQLEKTIHEYELLKDEYPGDISTHVTLGYLYIAADQPQRAAETFDRAILIHPDNYTGVDNELEQLIQDGQLYEAAEQLEAKLVDQPENANLILMHADILVKLGAHDEALQQYRQAIQICPDYLEATIKLGSHYLNMNQPQLAARQFNIATEINDQIVDAYIGLAIARKQGGSTSDALATLSMAAAIQPNSSLLFAETASLQFKMQAQRSDHELENPIEDVIKAHRSQIADQPLNPDLHYRFGILMMSVNRTSQAIKAFQAALAINPAYMRAASKLAVCLFESNMDEQALALLTQPSPLDSDTLQLHYQTALLYCDRIKFASSLMNLENQMQKNLTIADTTVNISIILQNLGLLDRADIMWDNLTETASLSAIS
jgi:tetratricopeptide (TPR) repeat protein